MLKLVSLVILTITIYCPGAGYPNGSSITGADWRRNIPLKDGDAACGPRYPFGTVFVVLDDSVERYVKSRVVTCHDRGSAIGNGNLDLTLMGGKAKLPAAFAWGKRRREVMVFRNLVEYRRVCAGLKRLGEKAEFCE
jgi:hypothetical protein